MMKKGINAYCNENCQKQFGVNKFDTKRIDDDIEKTYFLCPHCNHEYAVYFTDEAVRKLQKKLRIIYRKIIDPNSDRKKMLLQEKMTRKRIKN